MPKPESTKKPGRRSSRCAATIGSAIGVYARIPDETLKAWIVDFKPRLVAWFAANPQRKICKVGWFYGRSIDLRRDNYEAKIETEMKRLLNRPNAEL